MLADLSLSFVSGAVLGALLLCLGLLIGIYLGRRAQAADNGGAVSPQQLLQVVAALNRWAQGFATDVHQHRTELDSLAAAQQQRPADGAQDLIALTRAANERLQARLTVAERSLQENAAQLASYMAEARTDMLTALPNRRALDEALVARASAWRREGQPLALLMVDVDHFKRLNDAYGHLAGDLVLQTVARVLQRTDNPTDFVARFGGEEFCLLLPGAGRETACRVAARLRQEVAASEFVHQGQPLRVTVSLGGAAAQLGDDPSTLVRRADAALYAAKQAGRNCSFWHNGRHCELLENSANPPAPATSATPAAAQLEEVVNDLRKKVQEFR